MGPLLQLPARPKPAALDALARAALAQIDGTIALRVQIWANEKYFPLAFSRAAVDKAAVHTLKLTSR